LSLYGRMYPWSKWRKHAALWKVDSLRTYLPDTAKLTPRKLLQFLEKYPVVFLKPCFGGGGRGIMKLTMRSGKVRVHTHTDRYEVAIDQIYSHMIRKIGKKSYILQQGIDLMDLQGRQLDFRVVLLKPGKKWRYMGVMGKWAPSGQIVTNHCRGGSSIGLSQALKSSLKLEELRQHELDAELREMGYRIAAALEASFPLITELGLDIGIDRSQRLWLIEANTRPQYNLFKDHADAGLYPQIQSVVRRLRQTRKR
jgi:hypothetical protein